MSWQVNCMERVSARISLILFLIITFLFLSAAKLAGIQIMHHSECLALADNQQSYQVSVEALRGCILDRNGFLLAGNVTSASFSIFWPNVSEAEECLLDSFASGISEYLDCEYPLSRTGSNLVIASDVSWEEAENIIASMPDFVDCRYVTRRTYPMGVSMSPVIGSYTENASQGLEHHIDDILLGIDGLTCYQRSEWNGLRALDAEADNQAPVHGRDVQLTIDARYQETAQQILEDAVESSESQWGAIVLLDPSNGDVLAMASYPVFNQDGTLARNHCVQSSHEPGSVFKAITLAAAIDGGYADLEDDFDCTKDYIELFGHRIHDSHPIREILSLREVIARSSNIGTVQLAELIPDSVLFSYCHSFGFGERSRIDFPSEQRGSLPAPSNWSGLSKASIAIGQEVSVTPLQLAAAYGAIANGGVLYRPRLLQATFENGVQRELANSPGHRVVSTETAAQVRSVLTTVVETGTGSSAAVPGVTVAGKTGTAERLIQGEYLSAFAGMVPADNPQLVAVVVFDQPEYEYRWGSALAAPVFSQVVSGVLATSPEIAIGESVPGDEMIAAVVGGR
ncbi:hypothetical protein CSA37_10475 [Candidatus Fermentibacteria bacterium]|nr:MAG: hypothetical protein CSA37_10475 [Candidatus Fermentibacteria bacterium]